ncbi:MAG: hypothetical protein KGI54_18400 [Pseudomonadota bacterium]|nr:hypothetical protein [Pseudomonadota bacterium]
MKKVTFEKENGQWYVVLPDWKGSKEDLAMVAGADTLLDKLSDNSNNIVLNVDIKPFKGMTGIAWATSSTGDYMYNSMSVVNHPFWLCSVAVFVFGNYPDNIYIKIKKK